MRYFYILFITFFIASCNNNTGHKEKSVIANLNVSDSDSKASIENKDSKVILNSGNSEPTLNSKTSIKIKVNDSPENILKFNIKEFNKRQRNGELRSMINDSIERFAEFNKDAIIEYEGKINEVFYYVKIFNSKTYFIKEEGLAFKGFPIGLHKYYSDSGVLLRTFDFDQYNSFSIHDVRKKILIDYKIDIFIKDNLIQFYREGEKVLSYHLFILTRLLENNKKRGMFRFIIDGNTGEYISIGEMKPNF